MLNLLSLLIGAISLLLVIPAFLPIVGLLNWLIIPFAGVGAIIGAMSSRTSGRNLNLVVIVIAVLRLSLTGGLF